MLHADAEATVGRAAQEVVASQTGGSRRRTPADRLDGAELLAVWWQGEEVGGVDVDFVLA